MEHPTGIFRAKVTVDHILGAAVALLMGLLVVDVLWQVFTRFVLQSPSRFTDELARYLLVWVGVLGAAYALGQRLHLAIDLLPSRLTGRGRHVLGLVIETAVLVFAVAVMIVGGIRLVGLTLLLRQTSAAMQIPLGYVYAVIPLSGVLIAFYTLIFMYEHVRALREDPEGPPQVPLEEADEIATTASYE
jgi:TRAP-type C4-dicarboxylate transport system permease small subunit